MKYNKILDNPRGNNKSFCFKKVIEDVSDEIIETSGIFGINEEENDPRLNFSELHIDIKSPSMFYVDMLRRSPDSISHTGLDRYAERVFSVCYGSLYGKTPPMYDFEGNFIEYDYLDQLKITPTLANYLRFKNILLPPNDPVFNTSEGRIEEFFAIVFPRDRVKSLLDPGNFRIKLGSLVLIDDSDAEESPLLHRKPVYEIVEATLIDGQYRPLIAKPNQKGNKRYNVYGLFYPSSGILLLDAKKLRDAAFSFVVTGNVIEYTSRLLVKNSADSFLSSLNPPYKLEIDSNTAKRHYVAYALRFLISGEDEDKILSNYPGGLNVKAPTGEVFQYFNNTSINNGNNFRERILRQLVSYKNHYTTSQNYFWQNTEGQNRIPKDNLADILLDKMLDFVSSNCYDTSSTSTSTPISSNNVPMIIELDEALTSSSLNITNRVLKIRKVFDSFGMVNLNVGFALFLQGLFNHNKHYSSISSWKTYFQFRNEEKSFEDNIFLKINWDEFNYSNNNTYVKDKDGNFYHLDFIREPKSYITTIGLYDDEYNLLAVAKLPNPIPKDFSKEYFVKVRLRKQ